MDNVTRDINALSAGTVAVLLREAGFPSSSYDDIDYIRESWLFWAIGKGEQYFVSWQQAWFEFVIAGGLVELFSCDYGDM